MEFVNAFKAYEWLIEDAGKKGISRAEIARNSGSWAQQITNTIQSGKVKFESVKNIADATGYDVKLVLTKKVN